MNTNVCQLQRQLYLLLLSATLCQPVAAQGGAGSGGASRAGMIEEVIVTAQRREQSLQDVPISITAFTGAEIEKARIRELRDYFVMTPNVSYQRDGTNRGSDISIRGIRNIAGRNNSFGFYVDEFNISPSRSTGAIDGNLADIERIEILRGPQGTQFGRNAVGGAVNITTQKPDTDDFFGSLSLGYGRYDDMSFRAMGNFPLVEDKAAVRANIFYQDRDAFIKNVGAGGTGNDREYLGGRVALRMTPADQLSLDVVLSHQELEQGAPDGVPDGRLSAFPQSYIGAVPINSGGLGFYPQNKNRIATDFPIHDDNQISILTATVTYEADAFTIKSITGYIDQDGAYDADVDFSDTLAFRSENEIGSDGWSTELRIESNSAGSWHWNIGAIYGENSTDYLQSDFDYGFAALFDGLADGDMVYQFTDKLEAKTTAVFGEVSYDFTPKLNVMLGARYTHDSVEHLSIETINIPALLFLSPFFVSTTPYGPISQSFNDFSPKAVATYKWSEDFMTYASISKGYKSGGANAYSLTVTPTPEYDEENLWNYEIGFKAELFDKRLRVNGTGFYMDWKDIQVNATTINIIGVAQSFVQNAAKASSAGFELEMAAVPMAGLEVQLGVGYLDAEFDDFTNGVFDQVTQDLSGNVLPRAPEWTLNATVEYTFSVPTFGMDSEGYVRAEWSYTDDQFENIGNAEEFAFRGAPDGIIPSYQIWNFRAGIKKGRYSIDAYVQNAFNEDYFTSVFNDISGGTYSFTGSLREINPRFYGIQATVNW